MVIFHSFLYVYQRVPLITTLAGTPQGMHILGQVTESELRRALIHCYMSRWFRERDGHGKCIIDDVYVVYDIYYYIIIYIYMYIWSI